MTKIRLQVNRNWPIILFLLARLVLFLSLPLEGLLGYGDLVHFYRLAEMGQPFIDLWVEFPPVFPILSRFLYILAAGREHTYYYLVAFVLTMAQEGSIAVFMQVSSRIHGKDGNRNRSWVNFALLIG